MVSLTTESMYEQRVIPRRLLGADDGQFAKVLKEDVPRIRTAFTNVYGIDREQYPKLTLIIVKKRHQTRFFVQSNDPPHPSQCCQLLFELASGVARCQLSHLVSCLAQSDWFHSSC
jgi:hypothetical protein